MEKMINQTKNILITGCAGFIGAACVNRLLLNTSNNVIGIDNLNDYYDVKLKEKRLERIKRIKDAYQRFHFIQGDICDSKFLEEIFEKYKPEIVISLAAQAGVRKSVEEPRVYIKTNIVGFFNILEQCRKLREINDACFKQLIFASSSSVYGNNIVIPYSEEDKTDSPISLYAATKKADEVMAYAYAHLYDIPTTGLRFFTVYGPEGRPDMSYYKFTQLLVEGKNTFI